MVKFTTICREGNEFQRETKFDIQRVFRNPDPSAHPLQRAREYQRALVATKVEKIFAQPFLGTLNGHSDSISVINSCTQNLSKLISGSFDGELRVWDIPSRKCLVQINAHQNIVKGVTFSADGQRVVSSSDDKSINLYDFPQMLKQKGDQFQDPLVRFTSNSVIGDVDHSLQGNQFVTSGQIVQVWTYERLKPIMRFDWGHDTVISVKYCPSDSNLIAGTSMDRCLILYDVRAESPIYKVSMMNKSMTLAWNPIEPINITLGNDDSNCYTFDIRKMEQAKMIYKDHIQAVLSVAYSPTGQEFVSGSFDKTIRIFPVDKGQSREVYHTQRMSQVNTVAFSWDAQTVFSGSNDMNIRLWKVKAAQKLGVVNKREELATNYKEQLKNKFAYNKEIKSIAKHRHVPKYILNAKKRRHEQKQSKSRKLHNMEVNNKTMYEKPRPERQQRIQSVIE